jgi:hypothetical protein
MHLLYTTGSFSWFRFRSLSRTCSAPSIRPDSLVKTITLDSLHAES